MNGVYDYQTTYQTAYEYFEALQVPLKRFISFENSAHTPFYDEPNRFIQVLQEIIAELES
jgi:pimeloyl-ACP methyl ester carboxylesterase